MPLPIPLLWNHPEQGQFFIPGKVLQRYENRDQFSIHSTISSLSFFYPDSSFCPSSQGLRSGLPSFVCDFLCVWASQLANWSTRSGLPCLEQREIDPPIILITQPLWIQLSSNNSSRGSILCARNQVCTCKHHFHPHHNSICSRSYSSRSTPLQLKHLRFREINQQVAVKGRIQTQVCPPLDLALDHLPSQSPWGLLVTPSMGLAAECFPLRTSLHTCY